MQNTHAITSRKSGEELSDIMDVMVSSDVMSFVIVVVFLAAESTVHPSNIQNPLEYVISEHEFNRIPIIFSNVLFQEMMV